MGTKLAICQFFKKTAIVLYKSIEINVLPFFQGFSKFHAFNDVFKGFGIISLNPPWTKHAIFSRTKRYLMHMHNVSCKWHSVSCDWHSVSCKWHNVSCDWRKKILARNVTSIARNALSYAWGNVSCEKKIARNVMSWGNVSCKTILARNVTS